MFGSTFFGLDVNKNAVIMSVSADDNIMDTLSTSCRSFQKKYVHTTKHVRANNATTAYFIVLYCMYQNCMLNCIIIIIQCL